MDILNFISWIKGGRQVSTVDATKTLIPLGLKDGRRDDGYLAGAITVQDLADQIAPPTPPPPSPVNPGSGFYPINKNGVFVDSGLSNTVSVLPPFLPPSVGSLGLKYYDDFSSKTLLALDPLNLAYTFGFADFVSGTSVSATAGISIQLPIGEMIMGCGISSPTNGVFKASGAMGTITIGPTPSNSIGVFSAGAPSIYITSGFTSATGPINAVTPYKWMRVRDDSGSQYFLPLYQ